MANLKILTTPNQTLRTKSRCISKLDKKVLRITRDIKILLEQSKIPGVGLSANQVGVLLRIFVARLSSDTFATSAPFDPCVFINPQITWRSKKLNTDIVPKEELCLEGCLSVPKIYALVKRPWAIKVKYQKLIRDKNNRLSERSERFEGFNSTLIQHEIDHLDGILFTDHAVEQGAQIYEIGKDEKLHPVIL